MDAYQEQLAKTPSYLDTQIGDVRNSIAINYGNNFGSQKTASDATSIAT